MDLDRLSSNEIDWNRLRYDRYDKLGSGMTSYGHSWPSMNIYELLLPSMNSYENSWHVSNF